LIAAPTLVGGAIAVVLLGFSIAAIFPTVLGLAGTEYASHSGTVFGILIGVALTGGMAVPGAAGRLVQGRGPGAGLSIVIGSALCIFALQIVAGRLPREKRI